jgi:hypothetical protein
LILPTAAKAQEYNISSAERDDLTHAETYIPFIEC